MHGGTVKFACCSTRVCTKLSFRNTGLCCALCVFYTSNKAVHALNNTADTYGTPFEWDMYLEN